MIACPDRFADIAEFMGVDTTGMPVTEAAKAGIDAIRELSVSIGIPAGLKELDVKEEDLKTMAENAQKDACMLTNPRKATLDQVIDIYKTAM
jgi:alcohol dehydrogenase